MRITELQLRKIIRKELLQESNRESRRLNKYREILKRNFKMESELATRRFLTNGFADKVRAQVSEYLKNNLAKIKRDMKKNYDPSEKYSAWQFKNYDIDNLAEYMVPADRKKRVKRVKDKANPYSLNVFPDVYSELTEELKRVSVKIVDDCDDAINYFKENPNTAGVFYSARGIRINIDHNVFAKHEPSFLSKLFDPDEGSEAARKIKALIGMSSKKGETTDWASVEEAMRQTIEHEISHAVDNYTTSSGYDTVEHVANKCIGNLKQRLSLGRKVDVPDIKKKETTRYSKGTVLSPTQIGSASFKKNLQSIIKPDYHDCYASHTDKKDPRFDDPRGPGTCQYLNIHSRSGQTEVRTRIKRLKSGKGTGPYTADMIKSVRASAGRNDNFDVEQLFSMLRDDVSDEAIAKAFNKVVPPG